MTGRWSVPVPPAQHPVLVINPRSGGGKAERVRLDDQCGTRGTEPVVLVPGADLVELVEKAVAEGADTVGMAGGDGSQGAVAAVVARHGIAMVVVPSGTAARPRGAPPHGPVSRDLQRQREPATGRSGLTGRRPRNSGMLTSRSAPTPGTP